MGGCGAGGSLETRGERRQPQTFRAAGGGRQEDQPWCTRRRQHARRRDYASLRASAAERAVAGLTGAAAQQRERFDEVMHGAGVARQPARCGGLTARAQCSAARATRQRGGEHNQRQPIAVKQAE